MQLNKFGNTTGHVSGIAPPPAEARLSDQEFQQPCTVARAAAAAPRLPAPASTAAALVSAGLLGSQLAAVAPSTARGAMGALPGVLVAPPATAAAGNATALAAMLMRQASTVVPGSSAAAQTDISQALSMGTQSARVGTHKRCWATAFAAAGQLQSGGSAAPPLSAGRHFDAAPALQAVPVRLGASVEATAAAAADPSLPIFHQLAAAGVVGAQPDAAAAHLDPSGALQSAAVSAAVGAQTAAPQAAPQAALVQHLQGQLFGLPAAVIQATLLPLLAQQQQQSQRDHAQPPSKNSSISTQHLLPTLQQQEGLAAQQQPLPRETVSAGSAGNGNGSGAADRRAAVVGRTPTMPSSSAGAWLGPGRGSGGGVDVDSVAGKSTEPSGRAISMAGSSAIGIKCAATGPGAADTTAGSGNVLGKHPARSSAAAGGAVLKLPVELPARLRKKIKMIQPTSSTWEQEAVVEPAAARPAAQLGQGELGAPVESAGGNTIPDKYKRQKLRHPPATGNVAGMILAAAALGAEDASRRSSGSGGSSARGSASNKQEYSQQHKLVRVLQRSSMHTGARTGVVSAGGSSAARSALDGSSSGGEGSGSGSGSGSDEDGMRASNSPKPAQGSNSPADLDGQQQPTAAAAKQQAGAAAAAGTHLQEPASAAAVVGAARQGTPPRAPITATGSKDAKRKSAVACQPLHRVHKAGYMAAAVSRARHSHGEAAGLPVRSGQGRGHRAAAASGLDSSKEPATGAAVGLAAAASAVGDAVGVPEGSKDVGDHPSKAADDVNNNQTYRTSYDAATAAYDMEDAVMSEQASSEVESEAEEPGVQDQQDLQQQQQQQQKAGVVLGQTQQPQQHAAGSRQAPVVSIAPAAAGRPVPMPGAAASPGRSQAANLQSLLFAGLLGRQGVGPNQGMSHWPQSQGSWPGMNQQQGNAMSAPELAAAAAGAVGMSDTAATAAGIATSMAATGLAAVNASLGQISGMHLGANPAAAAATATAAGLPPAVAQLLAMNSNWQAHPAATTAGQHDLAAASNLAAILHQLQSPVPAVTAPQGPVNVGMIGAQLGMLYSWYASNRAAYLEQVQVLLQLAERDRVMAAAIGPTAFTARPPALRALDKALEIIRGSQALEQYCRTTSTANTAATGSVGAVGGGSVADVGHAAAGAGSAGGFPDVAAAATTVCGAGVAVPASPVAAAASIAPAAAVDVKSPQQMAANLANLLGAIPSEAAAAASAQGPGSAAALLQAMLQQQQYSKSAAAGSAGGTVAPTAAAAMAHAVPQSFAAANAVNPMVQLQQHLQQQQQLLQAPLAQLQQAVLGSGMNPLLQLVQLARIQQQQQTQQQQAAALLAPLAALAYGNQSAAAGGGPQQQRSNTVMQQLTQQQFTQQQFTQQQLTQQQEQQQQQQQQQFASQLLQLQAAQLAAQQTGASQRTAAANLARQATAASGNASAAAAAAGGGVRGPGPVSVIPQAPQGAHPASVVAAPLPSAGLAAALTSSTPLEARLVTKGSSTGQVDPALAAALAALPGAVLSGVGPVPAGNHGSGGAHGKPAVQQPAGQQQQQAGVQGPLQPGAPAVKSQK